MIAEAYTLLGLPNGAPADTIRRAYLELVKRHRPDKEPEKFRAVHAAYQLLNDPLVQAQALLEFDTTPIDLEEAIKNASKKKPRIPKLALLALGNQQ